MLRDIRTLINKPVPATYKAAAAMKTGMAVVLDDTAGTAKFASSATSANLYFVDKARVPVGIKAAYQNLSDYDEGYINVAKDEYVKLKKYLPGDEFATDAKGTGATVGKTVAAGADGKLVNATSASPYLYVTDYNDNGHELMLIRVLDTPVANS